jgi:uncharacterized alkaline shock family protein YloU
VTGPELSLNRGVVDEMVRLAAYEVPGVARVSRGGPAWRALLSGPPVVARVAGGGVSVRIWVVARPGQSLATVSREVRAAVAAAIERLLRLRLDSVTVTVDGVGG